MSFGWSDVLLRVNVNILAVLVLFFPKLDRGDASHLPILLEGHNSPDSVPNDDVATRKGPQAHPPLADKMEIPSC